MSMMKHGRKMLKALCRRFAIFEGSGAGEVALFKFHISTLYTFW